MAENLRVTHYHNGDVIPTAANNGAWAALTTGAYCWYDNDSASYAKYGALYNWYAVDDSRGLCPAGWHVPTHAEWTTLSTYLGEQDVAGGKMKSVSAFWTTTNADATNNSGFSGLPGGARQADGSFHNIGTHGQWWSSSENSSSLAWGRFLVDYDGDLHWSSLYKQNGQSVRCLRDY
jgi:uncharacterized protein (TIGR02145 family)